MSQNHGAHLFRQWVADFPQRIVVGLLIVPYVALSFRFSLAWPRLSDVWVFSVQQTFLQAVVSTLILLVVAVPAALGLLGQGRERYGRTILFLVAVPALLPTVIPVSAFLQMGTWWGGYPLGWWGVLLAHVAVNLGLASVLTASLIERRCGRWAELAAVEGANSFMFWRVLLSAVRRDLWVLFCGFFILFYFSLQVPMLLGGGAFRPVELLMLESLRDPGAWNEIWTISVAHLLAFGGLMITVGRVEIAEIPGHVSWRYFRPFWKSTLAFLPVPVIFLGTVWEILSVGAWPSLGDFPLIETFFSTFVYGMTTGGIVLGFLLCLSWSVSRVSTVYILRSGLVPSLALWMLAMLGLGLLAWPSILGSSFVLALWFLPMLYRWGAQAVEASVATQRQVAQVMGASHSLIFRRIVMPQVIAPFSRLAAVAGAWACGDYVVAPFFFGDRPPFGEVMAQAMQSHRWNWVPPMLMGIVICSSLCFVCFEVFSHVFGKEAHKELR